MKSNNNSGSCEIVQNFILNLFENEYVFMLFLNLIF